MINPETLDKKCYKRNYLTQVIARVDFLAPVESISKKLPESIISELKKTYPLVESKKVVANELKISPKDQQLIKHESLQWNFHGADREKSITITSDSAFILYNKFETYQQLKDEFETLCEVLFNNYDELGAKRLGLRYVNNIKLQEDDPLDWSQYLNKDMLRMINFKANQEYLNRLMNIIEYRFDTHYLRYQFGMHNPDYPSRIKQKVFVIDLDAYSDEYHSLHGIIEPLDVLHFKIQEIFENSITQKFKDHLDA